MSCWQWQTRRRSRKRRQEEYRIDNLGALSDNKKAKGDCKLGETALGQVGSGLDFLEGGSAVTPLV